MTTYKPELDSFRAYAAMLVVAGHHFPWQMMPNYRLDFGRMGVTAFFVLSGFLISSILLSYAYKVERGLITYYGAWKTFFIRRSLRIFPLYFVSLFIFGFVFHHFRLSSDIWWHITYTSNIGQAFFSQNFGGFNHFWSLCVEEQFYLLWPFLILNVGTNGAIRLVKSVIGFSLIIILIFIFYELNGKPMAYSPIGVNSLALSLGALLSCLLRSSHASFNRIKFFMMIVPALLTFILVNFVSSDYINNTFEQALHDSSWAILCFYFLYLSSTRNIKFMHNKLTIWLGKISYGIYVYHMLISVFLWYFFKWTHINSENYPILELIVKISLSLLLATISYYAFEIHFLRLKNRLAPD